MTTPHLAALYLTDLMVRSPRSEPPLTGLFPPKAVNFYPTIGVHGPIEGWFTSPSTQVINSDDEPILFTPVRRAADLMRPSSLRTLASCGSSARCYRSYRTVGPSRLMT
jgi:hypothetical protein